MFRTIEKLLRFHLHMNAEDDAGGSGGGEADDALSALDTDVDTDGADVTTGGDDGGDDDVDVTTDEFDGLFGRPEEGSEYEAFALPEDMPRDEEAEEGFRGLAKSLNLSQAGAQKVVDWAIERQKKLTASTASTIQESHQAWQKEIRADTEFGGANMKQTLSSARAALKVIDPKGELNEVLKITKLGSHPAVVRALARAHKAVGEAEHKGGGGGSDQRDLATKMYETVE